MASINNFLARAAEPIDVSCRPIVRSSANSLLTRASNLAQLPLTPIWCVLQLIASTCITALSCATLGQVKWLHRKSEAIHSSRIGTQHLIAAPVFKALGVISPSFCRIHNNGMEVFDIQENGLLTHKVQSFFNLIINNSFELDEPHTVGIIPHIAARITVIFALMFIPVVRALDLVIGLGALVVTILTFGHFLEVNKVAYRGLQITGIIGDLFWAINLFISPYSVVSAVSGASAFDLASITTVASTKESIANHPLFHLKRLTASLKRNSKFNALFLEQNLKTSDGRGPGLAREYLTDLTLALTRKYPDLFNSTGARLASEQDLELNGKYTSESEARSVCYHLGELFAWAEKAKMPLGDTFSPLLFNILTKMSEEEVTTSLETGSYLSPKALTPLEKLMYPRLFEELQHKKLWSFLQNNRPIETPDGESKSSDDPHERMIGILYPHDSSNPEHTVRSPQKDQNLKTTYEQFRQGLIRELFPDDNLRNPEHANLSDEELKPLLIAHLRKTFARQARSIQYIAQGMEAKGSRHFNIQPKTLEQSIQGVSAVNRDAIIALIRNPGGGHVAAQIQWLKEWLRDVTTTDDEVRLFVRFIAGSSALKPQLGIPIGSIGTILPNAHSCAQQLDLPNKPMTSGPHSNQTKADFINLMKYVMNQPLTYGSM